uniref:Uncharacterized protein n=1 Tax=Quercus lobata TaxID=97700 RepID=A0A7N2RD23_QUELO
MVSKPGTSWFRPKDFDFRHVLHVRLCHHSFKHVNNRNGDADRADEAASFVREEYRKVQPKFARFTYLGNDM